MPRPYAHGLRRCPRRAETRAGRPRQRFAGDTSPCVPPTWDATCYRCRVSRWAPPLSALSGTVEPPAPNGEPSW